MGVRVGWFGGLGDKGGDVGEFFAKGAPAAFDDQDGVGVHYVDGEEVGAEGVVEEGDPKYKASNQVRRHLPVEANRARASCFP